MSGLAVAKIATMMEFFIVPTAGVVGYLVITKQKRNKAQKETK